MFLKIPRQVSLSDKEFARCLDSFGRFYWTAWNMYDRSLSLTAASVIEYGVESLRRAAEDVSRFCRVDMSPVIEELDEIKVALEKSGVVSAEFKLQKLIERLMSELEAY